MRIEIASDHIFFFFFFFFFFFCISIEEWIKNSLVNVFLLSKKYNDLFKFNIFYFPIISYILSENLKFLKFIHIAQAIHYNNMRIPMLFDNPVYLAGVLYLDTRRA